MRKYCKKSNYCFNFNDDNSPKVLSCGSIMRLSNAQSVIYGSGIRNKNQVFKCGTNVMVRGPLTQNRIIELGGYCPPVYGDLGSLLPMCYRPEIKKKYKLGIIPHHIHYKKVMKNNTYGSDILIINLLNSNIEQVIDQILSCSKTISSSLHGLIVSDAYGIPN